MCTGSEASRRNGAYSSLYLPMRPGLEPVQICQLISQVEFSEVCHVTARRETSSTANKTIKRSPQPLSLLGLAAWGRARYPPRWRGPERPGLAAGPVVAETPLVAFRVEHPIAARPPLGVLRRVHYPSPCRPCPLEVRVHVRNVDVGALTHARAF